MGVSSQDGRSGDLIRGVCHGKGIGACSHERVVFYLVDNAFPAPHPAGNIVWGSCWVRVVILSTTGRLARMKREIITMPAPIVKIVFLWA